MNERLRDLVRQAGLDDADFPIENWDNVPLTKFGELIVRECAGIIESQDVDPSFKLRMSWAVKQYFGVEE